MSSFQDAMRRVITGDNTEGKSVIIIDGGPSSQIGGAELGGLFEIWEDAASGKLDPRLHDDLDTKRPVLGPRKGNVQVRWFVINPTPPGVPKAELDKAVRLDPRYAAAQVRRAYTLMFVTNLAPTSTVAQMQGTMALAIGAASRAVELAPNWGVAHAARGAILLQLLELGGAEREFASAIVLAPYDTGVDRSYAFQEAYFGHCAAAEASSARVVSRFPLEAESYEDQAQVLYLCRRFEDSLAALRHVGALIAALPSWDQLYFALDYLAEGKLESARKACAANRNEQQTLCLAIIMHQLGRQPEAMAYLAALYKSEGDSDSYQYAEIYAQWGDRNNALAWLATACKVRDTGLVTMKADPLLDPIRATPEFAALERRLGFPP